MTDICYFRDGKHDKNLSKTSKIIKFFQPDGRTGKLQTIKKYQKINSCCVIYSYENNFKFTVKIFKYVTVEYRKYVAKSIRRPFLKICYGFSTILRGKFVCVTRNIFAPPPLRTHVIHINTPGVSLQNMFKLKKKVKKNERAKNLLKKIKSKKMK